jgi:hypothetical protein
MVVTRARREICGVTRSTLRRALPFAAAAVLLAMALAPVAAGAPSVAARLPIVVIDADGPIVDDPKVARGCG